MNHNLFVLLSILFLFTTCESPTSDTTTAELQPLSEMGMRVDEYFTALNQLEKFNGLIYATMNGRELLKKAYNLDENAENTTYVSPNSQFDIHSVSKLMAHYLIEKFEIEGKVKKSQTINDFIEGFPKGDQITIEMLLNHTSGLPRGFQHIEGDALDLTSIQIMEYAKQQAFLFEPGADTQYSNVAFEIIYFILQKISNKTFAQCLSDEVFQVLGMDHSGAHFYLDNKNLKNLAKNHKKRDTAIVQVANVLPDELKTARIFSTAEDLNKFLNHIKKEPYASLLKNSSGVIEKNGGNDGIRVEIYTNLNENYNFILLANYDEIPFQKTVEDFVKILENKPYEIPKELNRQSIQVPLEIIKRYTGTYSFADLGNINLTLGVIDGALVVYQDGQQIGALKAESETLFFEDPKLPESFEFIDNGKGGFNVLMGFQGVKLKGVKQ